MTNSSETRKFIAVKIPIYDPSLSSDVIWYNETYRSYVKDAWLADYVLVDRCGELIVAQVIGSSNSIKTFSFQAFMDPTIRGHVVQVINTGSQKNFLDYQAKKREMELLEKEIAKIHLERHKRINDVKSWINSLEDAEFIPVVNKLKDSILNPKLYNQLSDLTNAQKATADLLNKAINRKNKLAEELNLDDQSL